MAARHTGPKRKPGRPPAYKPQRVAGKWKIKFMQKCREMGYIHTSGPHTGRPNFYRITIESGITRQYLYNILKRGFLSTTVLGQLCDIFHCQPNDLLERVTTEQAGVPLIDLPDFFTEEDLPGDEYVHPSQL